MINLHKDHRARLRKRYEEEGLESFSDHMILELLLFRALPRVDTNPIGHRLMNRFQTLAGVFSASEEELCEVQGIGPASAAMICSVRQRMLFDLLNECDLTSVNERLAIAAEYHMRTMPDLSVSLFTWERVMDYCPDGTGAEGLCEVIRSDMEAHGITLCAVVLRCDKARIPPDVLEELQKGWFPAVFRLRKLELTKLFE